ncbi:hypothetical protein D0Y65_001285 [Glycine soja]|uniref:Uncharacterized protein n=1 Tax=Glycine soja TaxID=3848 RepID=A0A445M2F2_GLYSO|nr:hypothetical protein JHK87_001476 [Glycine soja]KAG5088873.1 hypothetical protein JHK86_001485 [Glycine max]RZC29633.1 hypothetical protein D0Y65_001284 [Glycine soja]RZC29634.1 hypothetical protein D0Y65_001285 [Glycine soja]
MSKFMYVVIGSVIVYHLFGINCGKVLGEVLALVLEFIRFYSTRQLVFISRCLTFLCCHSFLSWTSI